MGLDLWFSTSGSTDSTILVYKKINAAEYSRSHCQSTDLHQSVGPQKLKVIDEDCSIYPEMQKEMKDDCNFYSPHLFTYRMIQEKRGFIVNE